MSTSPKPARSAAKVQSTQPVTALYAPSDQQAQRRLFPITEVEVDGIQMGVLSDGTPYLTMRGLARMCGIDNTSLFKMADNWDAERNKPRGKKLQELLAGQGHAGDALYLRAIAPNGRETHAYTDAACMAILEYYAFEASQSSSEIALKHYRLLARSSFRQFIYARCGYDPNKHIPESWRTFHERVLLNDQVPIGYFSVFREVADLVVHLIHGGCPLDSHTVPDISVGQMWGKYWSFGGLEETYGERIKAAHNYPGWFPQSAANPVDVWIYPVQALGDFKIWLYENYLVTNFPKYVGDKVKKGLFLPARAQQLIATMQSKPKLPAPPRLPA